MSKTRLLISAILIFTACIPAISFEASVSPEERNAILFSWDGVPREYLNECLSRNELPNLAALIKEGNVVNIDITHKTDTKAGHTQMLTGYDPDVTGVISNSKFKAIPQGLSIFERLEEKFGDDKITTIMLTGKTHHIGACPPCKPEEVADAKARLKEMGPATGRPVLDPDAERERQQSLRKNRRARTQETAAVRKAKQARERLNAIVNNTDGEPFYLVSRNLDVWDGEKSRNNTVNGPLMLKYLDQYGKGRFFAFFHFSDPDHMGHNHGENSKEFTDAIIACDRWLGEVVRKLKDLGVYDKTMIFVTADHGFDEGKTSHGNAPRVVLAANVKSLSRNGDQRDIVPTLLTEMGVDISAMEPKFKGVVLTSK